MQSAQLLAEAGPLDAESERLLVEAIAREQVPRIKSVLVAALRNTQRGGSPEVAVSQRDSSTSDVLEVLQDLGSIIRHELLPAIGWLRFAADGEIEEFGTSETNNMIQALRRRIDGVVALAEAQRLPVMTSSSLSELLAACVPPNVPVGLFSFAEVEDGEDLIETDPGLFMLIGANALQNAVDAVLGLPPGEGQIFVAVGVSEKDFWLTISNSFAGASFDLNHVAASGVTSKSGHRGLGVRVMRLAAGRLGYRLDLVAAGGVATLSLRGRRRDA